MQRTPSGPVQRATRDVADAITTGVRQMLNSGLKAMQRGKNQGLNATVQQGDASTIANTSSVKVPNSNNSRTNATLEHGAVNPNASLLSEFGSRTPHFGVNTSQNMSQFSHITGQVATPTQGTTPSGHNPSTPPRLDTSGVSSVTEVGTDLLDIQGATPTTSSTSVVGTLIDAPSPRQNVQSPETHQLQQTLRVSASEQLQG